MMLFPNLMHFMGVMAFGLHLRRNICWSLQLHFEKGGISPSVLRISCPLFIDHLVKLRNAGYVHGDIRAFNTVVSNEEGGPGYLVDFDFSGKAGKVVYPGDTIGIWVMVIVIVRERREKVLKSGKTGTHLVN